MTFGEAQTRIETELAAAIEQAAALVEARAKELCPVRTGRLRDSIRAAVTEIAGDVLRAEVSSDVPYAAAVELGTRRAPAQPFLFPALEACRDEVRRIIEDCVRRAIG
jgi:HK97 gp10 family phage protein